MTLNNWFFNFVTQKRFCQWFFSRRKSWGFCLKKKVFIHFHTILLPISFDLTPEEMLGWAGASPKEYCRGMSMWSLCMSPCCRDSGILFTTTTIGLVVCLTRWVLRYCIVLHVVPRFYPTIIGFLRGVSKKKLRIPREDWGTLGKIRGITTRDP